jgi:hypothetical protein
VDRPTPALPQASDRSRSGSEHPLVRAALRRRRAERAFEDYVREMARRWRVTPGHNRTDGGGEALPRA